MGKIKLEIFEEWNEGNEYILCDWCKGTWPANETIKDVVVSKSTCKKCYLVIKESKNILLSTGTRNMITEILHSVTNIYPVCIRIR